MIRALVMKEWRETWAFGALAFVVYLAHLGNYTGLGGPVLRSMSWLTRGADGKPPELPFINDNFTSTVGFVGCLLAIALGFRQSAWEPHQGTALYLLHLPLSRRAILATKIFSGVGLLLACSLVPIVLYGTWASWPRTHPGPFEWSMTGSAFRTWAIGPLVYLGAFASGMRPARWFGTRLFPLVATMVPATFSVALPAWWLLGLPILLLAAALLVATIFQEAETRDY